MFALIASIAFGELSSFLFPLVIIAMSMSIPIVAIVTDHLQKKERMRLVEKAIEHGADLKELNLDPDGDCSRRPRLPYRSGMILIGVGIALLSANYFLDESFGDIHFPLLVGGLITSCIGIAQLLNDWFNRGRLEK